MGTAVIATASSAAWAAIANDDSPKRTPTPAAAQTSTRSSEPATANEAARQSTPKSPSPAPKPPSAAHPSPTKSAEHAAKPTGQPTKGADEPAKPSQQPVRARTEAVKPKVRVLSSGSCGASFYDEPQMTASGERFNPSAMTAAHKTLPLGSRVRVTNPNTGESVKVRINDRGPYIGGRCLDLSAAAFEAIGNTSAGVMRVKYEVLAR
ncbi:septal ring lytic transglycosylase RlpA family protein [Nonomuraea polychroma]|uniref:septal ring lytic transglycosylase RlpA family protein n=1 Tax=Nonomuraea polychroma TaxID=46176 RepID=UPI003D92D6AE